MKIMTSLAAIIALTGSMAAAVAVDTTSGSSTQQEIKHIFDAANDLSTHDDDSLPARTETFYLKWPTSIAGAETTVGVPKVEGVAVSGGNFLADTSQLHQITERGEDILWRSIQDNRDMTLNAINIDLFDDVRGLEVIDTNHFRSVRQIDDFSPAPVLQDINNGIVGDAIDQVIFDANTANWNAVRAFGAGNAGLADDNVALVNDVLNNRIAINNVLNEYDEAAARIVDGLE